MSRIAYVNRRYVPHRQGAVHIEDRGFQFADGVYEVIAVIAGRLVDEPQHFERLARSLAEIDIEAPVSVPALKLILREVIRRNRVRDGIVYLQITRGVAPRDHAYPANVEPSLVVTARRMTRHGPDRHREGVRLISVPDIRWQRCDIKSISLLPNVLAKQRAREAGAFEAWQVDADGFVTEGASTNAWIVSAEGDLVTRAADSAILDGVTRRAVIALASEAGLPFVERAFSLEEAKSAREAFCTSTTSLVMPVVSIDGEPVGDGRPGPFSRQLAKNYDAYLAKVGESP